MKTEVSKIELELRCWCHAPWIRAIAFVGFALLSAQGVYAQEVPAGISAPTYSLTDPNGINLVSNKPNARLKDVSIGDERHPLSHSITTIYEQPSQPSVTFIDTYNGRILPPYSSDPSTNCAGMNSIVDVSIAGAADRMCGTAGGAYISQRSSGGSMTTNGDGTLTYTDREGTRYSFAGAWLAQIASPDGRIATLTYKIGNVGSLAYRRLQSVTRNDGLQIKYTYATNSLPASGYPTNWLLVANVRAINNAVDYCDPQADSCTLAQPWPFASHVWTTSGSVKYYTVTDAGGRATRFTTGIPVLSGGVYRENFLPFYNDQLLAVRAPTSTSSDTMTYTFCAPSGEYYCMKAGVKSVTTNGVVWTYTGTSGAGGPSIFIQLTSTRPGGPSRSVTQQIGNYAQGPLMSYGDGALRTFYFESALTNRLSSVLSADGDRFTYAYDSRSNITSEIRTPASGSTLQATTRLANYDLTCANLLTCNKPNWVKDARGNQTDFKWDPIHGGVVSVTSPPDNSGIRAQKRSAYAQRYAWYKNATGTVVQASTPIWVLATEKVCRSTAALADGTGCTVPADEVTTTYDYGPTSGANNLFLRGMSVTADGVTHRTCYAYDIYGNRVGETFPRAGLSSCP